MCVSKSKIRIIMRLLSFTVSNFRSFYSEQTIEFQQDRNAYAIFGANGSGKTNLFRALLFYRDFVFNSTNYIGQSVLKRCSHFAFREGAEEQSTTFVAEFATEKHIVRHKFSLLHHKVIDESLELRNELEDAYRTIFRRPSLKNDRFQEYGFGSDILQDIGEESLVLTHVKFNRKNKYADEVFDCLEHLKIIAGSQPAARTAEKILNDPEFEHEVLTFMQRADFSVNDISVSVKEVDIPDELIQSLPLNDNTRLVSDGKGFNISLAHIKRGADGEKAVGKYFLDVAEESSGTQRMFQLAYPILDTLKNGNILYIDEFETHLHPLECQFIVELFNSKENNPNNAQLIVNTHNAPTLRQVGRDGARFVGKNSRDESIIGEAPKTVIREGDMQIDRKYLKNVFGYVPKIGW